MRSARRQDVVTHKHSAPRGQSSGSSFPTEQKTIVAPLSAACGDPQNRFLLHPEITLLRIDPPWVPVREPGRSDRRADPGNRILLHCAPYFFHRKLGLSPAEVDQQLMHLRQAIETRIGLAQRKQQTLIFSSECFWALPAEDLEEFRKLLECMGMR